MHETIVEIMERSRRLRNNQTPAEKQLWKYLRKRQLCKAKFLRQYPIKFTNQKNNKVYYFITDFYCHEYKLIIEVDGSIHKTQIEYDTRRKYILKQMGFTILRFTNEAVFHNIGHVIIQIKRFLTRPSPF